MDTLKQKVVRGSLWALLERFKTGVNLPMDGGYMAQLETKGLIKFVAIKEL